MPPSVLRIKLKTVTPAFIGSAILEKGELRSPPIKGLLRYWYRAADDRYAEREKKFFGSTEGQSPCLLKIAGQAAWEQGTATWSSVERNLKDQFLTGIRYLGYGLRDARIGIEENSEFELVIRERPRIKDVEIHELQKAWLAAAWMLCNIGGIGARSRRGFGSLQICDWSGWDECTVLPRLDLCETIEEWEKKLRDGLKSIEQWFPRAASESKRTIVSSQLEIAIAGDEPTWQRALGKAGAHFQSYRRDLKLPEEKACFGLPIVARKKGAIVGEDKTHKFERWASPLMLRIVRIGDRYHPVFLLLHSFHPPGVLKFEQNTSRWPDEAQRPVREFLAELHR